MSKTLEEIEETVADSHNDGDNEKNSEYIETDRSYNSKPSGHDGDNEKNCEYIETDRSYNSKASGHDGDNENREYIETDRSYNSKASGHDGDYEKNSELYIETDRSYNAKPSGYDEKIKELYKISMESIRIKARYDYELFCYEKLMENQTRHFVERRAEIVRDWLKSSPPGGDGSTKAIYFWLKVLKSSDIGHYIAEDDEPILQHLLDIRGTTIPDEERIHFVIEFHFEPNDYFTNTKLTKAYYSRMLGDWKEPLKYDGFALDFTLGCTIMWTAEEAERRKNRDEDMVSFFDFFNTPDMPENAAEYDGDGDFQTQIDYSVHCFGIGFYIKDFLLPQSILFFKHAEEVEEENELNQNQNPNRNQNQNQVNVEEENVEEVVNVEEETAEESTETQNDNESINQDSGLVVKVD